MAKWGWQRQDAQVAPPGRGEAAGCDAYYDSQDRWMKDA
jgi:hypothetical protein